LLIKVQQIQEASCIHYQGNVIRKVETRRHALALSPNRAKFSDVGRKKNQCDED